MRVLITGSRNWTDEAAIREAIIAACHDRGRNVTVVHGDARGADRIAAKVARSLGYTVESHPANWGKHGKAAGHVRNHEMVARGADVCLAFPLGESKGTRGCMAAARKAGIAVIEQKTTGTVNDE